MLKKMRYESIYFRYENLYLFCVRDVVALVEFSFGVQMAKRSRSNKQYEYISGGIEESSR